MIVVRDIEPYESQGSGAAADFSLLIRAARHGLRGTAALYFSLYRWCRLRLEFTQEQNVQVMNAWVAARAGMTALG